MKHRRHLRTRNRRDHITAVRERRLLEFGEACVIAGMTRVQMKRELGPDGQPFRKVGLRLFVAPAELKAFLTNLRAARRAI